MRYWKEHAVLRVFLMLAGFSGGLGIIVRGWRMQGDMTGLLMMLAGVALLIAALLLYNKPFE